MTGKVHALPSNSDRDLSCLFDLEAREVSLSTMYDPELYQIEMEKIFTRVWLMLGHESEIPKSGDYVVRNMGEDEVIVARDRQGEIHVSLNVCPHRGMHICTAEQGNSQAHKCIYHGWTFRPDGSFIGAPIEKEKMHGEILSKEQLGLKKARVQIFHGFVYATWDHDAAPLEEQLGDMKFYYDIMFGKTHGGMEVLGPPQRLTVHANWKTAGEQAACDGFHTLTLHRSQIDIGNFGGEGDSKDDSAPAMYGINVCDKGNALRCISADSTFRMLIGQGDLEGLSQAERLERMPPPGIYTEQHKKDMLERLSDEQLHVASVAPPQVGNMFPNLNLLYIYAPLPNGTLGSGYVVHAINPKGPDKFQWLTWFLCEKGTPEEIKDIMRAVAVQTGGTSGLIEQDDTDTWPHMTAAARGVLGKTETLKYQAIAGEDRPEGWPDQAKVYAGFSKDDAQWTWWLQYHDLMTK
jgi:phenylpropionate dioxygenase-like ring-hydroxylating dioxygenase large terminal subunit